MKEKITQNGRNVFEDSSISRRQFVRMSAATAGAVALPGQAFADVSSSKLTAEYEYVLNHTEERESIPTLVILSDEAGLDTISELDLPLEARTTTEPAVAAHVYLTTEQVERVLDIDSVNELRFSPGSNPFWLLDHYPQGVFPDPENSVDYIDYEQLSRGMNHLVDQYPDRLRFESIGPSPGHYNFLAEEEDPKDVWVAELTNDIDNEERFREKQKLVVSLSIHGDERGGVEAGTRFIEDVLTGTESTVEALLDEVVLVFVYTNPDGWVGRYPQYNDRSEGYSRYSAGTTRFSDEPLDPNRNYPTIGWINATHYPAEPNGLDLQDMDAGIDRDTAGGYTDNAIDSLSIVDHLRGYENLAYALDLHGMYTDENFILNLVMNDEYLYEELNDIYEYNRSVEQRLEENLGPLLETNDELFEGLQTEEFFGEDATIPESPFSYGTIYDTIEYSTTGTFASWMAHPEEEGGLGMTAMSPEMAFNNVPTPTTFAVPEDFDVSNLVELWVTGFTTMLRTLVEHAGEEMKSVIETNYRSTAIVTTDELTRSSEQLTFVERDELEVSSPEEGVLTGSVRDDNGDRTVATPDPEEILDYEQRSYEVTPFAFFEDLRDDVVDDARRLVEVTINDVCNGELLSGDGDVAYDNLVIIDDSGTDNRAYLEALDDYVEADGNLVLTDTGVTLLGELDNELAAGIDPDDITTEERTFPLFEEDSYPHPLLTDTREMSQEPWKLAPLGYGIVGEVGEESGEAPITLIDQDAFTAVDGQVASTTAGRVAVGSLMRGTDGEPSGINVVGSLLPPARQTHLHPFGMANHTVSFFGLLIMTNALGYSHSWYVNDELVQKIGAPESDDGEEETDDLA